jgi:type I restriction enzyme S subunit
VLSAYDDLIENNTRRIAILEEMAQAIYREWFVNFRFPGHENAKLVDKEQDLPHGWQRKTLPDLADLRLGKMLDAKKNNGDLMPYLANINVRWGAFDLQSLREMKYEADELETYGLRYGDIVMCEGGEPGRCAIWTGQVPNMKLQKAIHRIRSRGDVGFRYLYYNLLHKAQAGYLESLFTGATIKHLPREKL